MFPEIPELDKPECVACPFLRLGNKRGECGQYSQRPDVCRSFLCSWVQSGHMPDRLRPDLTGIVMSYGGKEKDGRPIVVVWETQDITWEDSEVYAWFHLQPNSEKFLVQVRRYDA